VRAISAVDQVYEFRPGIADVLADQVDDLVQRKVAAIFDFRAGSPLLVKERSPSALHTPRAPSM
jgi:hypothetical protein